MTIQRRMRSEEIWAISDLNFLLADQLAAQHSPSHDEQQPIARKAERRGHNDGRKDDIEAYARFGMGD
jgi:hypothetical protein